MPNSLIEFNHNWLWHSSFSFESKLVVFGLSPSKDLMAYLVLLLQFKYLCWFIITARECESPHEISLSYIPASIAYVKIYDLVN